jgi:[ribosomal protein S18]-alanine N-acetyltransferase
MAPYLLTPARLSDAKRLAAMSQQWVEAGLKPSWGPTRIAWHIRDAASVVLTARVGAAPEGFAIMRYADESAHLNLLAITPAYRRRGMGRALVSWLEETALTAGAFAVSLELRAGNLSARAFYAALGYQEGAEIPGYYQGQESAVRMTRDVRTPHKTPGAPQAAP